MITSTLPVSCLCKVPEIHTCIMCKQGIRTCMFFLFFGLFLFCISASISACSCFLLLSMSPAAVCNCKITLYSDDSFIRTSLFSVNISGLTSFPDYWIAHKSRRGNRFPLFVQNSKISGLSEPGLANRHCTCFHTRQTQRSILQFYWFAFLLLNVKFSNISAIMTGC